MYISPNNNKVNEERNLRCEPENALCSKSLFDDENGFYFESRHGRADLLLTTVILAAQREDSDKTRICSFQGAFGINGTRF